MAEPAGLRVMLAAICCQQGDWAVNLAAHDVVLRRARNEGCQLAVFPEMSLSGSVDPGTYPERLLRLESAPVQSMAQLTGQHSVAAIFGIAELGEGRVDYPFDEPAAAGAEVIFFCAAPGRYGRRTDEEGWRAGHAWWESCGLADARRHAVRTGAWVALATQAGSAVDEDFPGIAALVAPAGEVVARLPEWRAGTLVVSLPFSISGDCA